METYLRYGVLDPRPLDPQTAAGEPASGRNDDTTTRAQEAAYCQGVRNEWLTLKREMKWRPRGRGQARPTVAFFG